jgi:hypothetical protein
MPFDTKQHPNDTDTSSMEQQHSIIKWQCYAKLVMLETLWMDNGIGYTKQTPTVPVHPPVRPPRPLLQPLPQPPQRSSRQTEATTIITDGNNNGDADDDDPRQARWQQHRRIGKQSPAPTVGISPAAVPILSLTMILPHLPGPLVVAMVATSL